MCASLLSGLDFSYSIDALSRGPTLAPYLASVATIFAPSRRAVRRSWRRSIQGLCQSPSMCHCRDHSIGASIRRVTPIPRGSRPCIAAVTRSGARNESEIIIMT